MESSARPSGCCSKVLMPFIADTLVELALATLTGVHLSMEVLDY